MSVDLGFAPGQVVQELYFDDDVEPAVAEAVRGATGLDMVDYDYQDVVDGVVLWWRADDADHDDLADVLLEAAANLDEPGGAIWVLSPKPGRNNYVAPQDIAASAKIAALKTTSAISVGPDWAGMRLLAGPRS